MRTQEDGRRYAIRVLQQLENVGRDKCRADRPGKSPAQHGGLIRALLDLKRNGSTQVMVGFAVVLTDRIGARLYGVDTWDYRELERCGRLRYWKPKPKKTKGALAPRPGLQPLTTTKPDLKTPVEGEPIGEPGNG